MKQFKVFLFAVFALFVQVRSGAQGVTTSLHFGCNAGGCSGRGVCSSNACTAPAITVTVNVIPPTQGSSGSYTFSLDLTQEIYDEGIQAPYWNTYPGTYTFDFPYDVAGDPNISGIVPAGMATVIPSGVPFPVTTYTVTPTDSPGVVHTMANVTVNPIKAYPQNLYVMFGFNNGSSPGPNCVNSTPGIYSVYTSSKTMTMADQTTATTVPVSFFLKPGAADTMVMTIPDQKFKDNQPEQYQNLNFYTGVYGATGSSSFIQPLIPLPFLSAGTVGIPKNSFYSGISPVRVSQSAGAQNKPNLATDSMFFPYYVFETPFSSTYSMQGNTQLTVNYIMPYSPIVTNVLMGQGSWGAGTVTLMTANDSLIASVMGQAGTPCVFDLTNTPLSADVSYHYTISFSCGASLNLASKAYAITVPPAGGPAGKMQMKPKKKSK